MKLLLAAINHGKGVFPRGGGAASGKNLSAAPDRNLLEGKCRHDPEEGKRLCQFKGLGCSEFLESPGDAYITK